MAKIEDSWADEMAWYSELEKEALKEAEGDLRADRKDEEERLKEEAGMIYKTASVKETAYEHMRQTNAEYHSETEDEEERRRRQY